MTVALPLREPETDDARLVLRARDPRGGQAAFRELYRRHARYVASVAYRMLGADAEVDDVVQDTFTVAAHNLEQLRDPGQQVARLRAFDRSRVRIQGSRSSSILEAWVGVGTRSACTVRGHGKPSCSARTPPPKI